MVNMFLKLHIWRRSHYYRIKYSDIHGLLMKAIDLPFIGNTKIVYSWLLDGWSIYPDAMSVIPGIIAVNAEWAARLVLFDSQDVWNAFRFTIGHEMTHQQGDYSFWEAFTVDKRFVNWIIEIHADYGGTILAFDGALDPALEAIEYKRADYRKDVDRQKHPSWERRKRYLSMRHFDKNLIETVASDCGCNNNNLIRKISEFYEDISLED